jgi:hypothetical protein
MNQYRYLEQELAKNIRTAQIQRTELIIPVFFSEQVETTIWYTVLCISTGGDSYPLYSKYNIAVFQVRHGVDCDITYYVKIIVTVRDSTVYYNRDQPGKASEYGYSPCKRNEYGTTREPTRVSGWRSQRITIHNHHRNRRR